MKIVVSLLASTLLLAACGDTSQAPLRALDLDLRAPIPGRAVSPGYLTLSNMSKDPITIDRIESPHYARIEIHETTNTGNVSRMRMLNAVTVPAGEQITMAPGGLHLMLFSQRQSAVRVTLNFFSEDTLLLTTTSEINAQ